MLFFITAALALQYGHIYNHCTIPDVIALTFDDGPGPDTPLLLDYLEKENIPVTFFVIGDNVKSRPETVKRAFEQGHQIASHTTTHANLSTLDDNQIEQEMRNTDEEIRKLIGTSPVYMRPPYGDADDQVLQKLEEMEYVVVNWDLDSHDWTPEVKSNPSKIVTAYEKAMDKEDTADSYIALNHDLWPTTVAQIPKVVEYVREKGYRFVTVHECLGGEGSPYIDGTFEVLKEEGAQETIDTLNAGQVLSSDSFKFSPLGFFTLFAGLFLIAWIE